MSKLAKNAEGNIEYHPHPEYLPASLPSDFLPPISSWLTLGGLFLCTAVGVVIGLAAFTPYRVTVKAPSRIRPVGKIRIIQSAVFGKVKNIQVSSNQIVKRGDMIASLDNSELLIQIKQLQDSIEQDISQLARINAQVEAIAQKIIAENNKINSTIASAEAEFSRQKRKYQDRTITTVAEVAEIQASLKLAQEEYNRYLQLANTGAISILQLREKEAALETAFARLRKVKVALNPSSAGMKIAQKQILSAQATGKASLSDLNAAQEELRQQKAEIANNLYYNRQELKKVQSRIQDTIIRSPVEGTIQELYLRYENQVVEKGDLLARIVPSNSPLKIKAWVAPEDISKVQVGQQALMKVSACPYPDYGVLSGTVSTIAPDSIQKKSSSNNITNVGFEVTIKPSNVLMNSKKKQCQVQIGMEGRTEIVTQEETVLSFMLRKARILTDL